MSNSTKSDYWELADYLRVIRRRWWVVVLLTCLGVAVAAAAIKLLHKTYTATASVSVNALPTDTRALPGGSVDMDTEAQLAQSHAVALVASRQLQGTQTPSQLTKAATVTVPPNTTLLNLVCQESKPGRAADCANAMASAYLKVRLTDSAATLTAQISSLRSRAQALLPEVTKMNLAQQQAKGPASTQSITSNLKVREANAQFSSITSRMNYLNSQLASVQAPNSTIAGHVVGVAHPPHSASSPQKLLLLPSGLLGGLIVGLIAAVLLDLRDDRVFTAREVERDRHLPTLLDLRTMQHKRRWRRAARGPLPHRALAELAESVAHARTEGCFVVLVAGTSPEAGTSLVAANLAAALSEARPDVFLIGAAPGATLAPQLLGVTKRAGLSELLAGKVMIDEVAQTPNGAPDLRVIAPGRKAGVTTSQRYDARHQLMSDLRAEAEYVIVESPLGDGVSPALTLAEFADAAILVIETTRTRRSDVDSWLRKLERVRVPVLGTVLVARRARRSRSPRGRASARRAAKPQQAQPAKPLAINGRATAGVAQQRGAR